MAFRSAGTLLTDFNAAFLPPGLMPGYQGHMPGMAFSFGSPYGSTTFKHFQDQRNKAMAKGHRGSPNFLPSLPAAAPALLLSYPDHPSTRFNLDVGRAAHFTSFYQQVQQHRTQYLDRSGTVNRVPYFVLPVKEADRYPITSDLPSLTPKQKWHLLNVSPENLRTYQTFPSGKRVSSQERQRRNLYFEFRA
ncbi:protein FAM166C [Suncus etruscus]|uniref:protein FAM166C n=1 Tax=Suncus etruscus TaxID=109475 RepID=UPI002110A610|nr:protein FAM166C [Suncus etruscus]